HRARRAVEGGERPVTGSDDGTAPEPGELDANRLVVPLSALGGEQRDERAVPLVRREARGAAVDEEGLDGVEDLVRVDADEVIRAGELDEPRTPDALGDVAALLDPDVVVGAAVDHEGGNTNRGQERADVDQRVHLDQRRDRAGARRGARALA